MTGKTSVLYEQPVLSGENAANVPGRVLHIRHPLSRVTGYW